MRPIVLALLLAPALALAAPPKVDISAPLLSFARPGAWVPVQVDVASTTGFDGRVLVRFGDEQQRRAFTVPDNGRRRILVPVHVPPSGYEVSVTVLAGRSQVLASKPLALPAGLDSEALTVAVIGEAPLGWTVLREIHAGPVDGHPTPASDPERRVLVETLLPDQLPRTWFGWSAADVVVWRRPDPAALSPEQQRALRTWVARGGTLVVALGDEHREWAASPLASLVPAADRGLVGSESAVERIAIAQGALPAAPEPLPIVDLAPNAADVEVVLTDELGAPLVLQRRIGSGRAALLAFDPGAAELGEFGGAALWRSLFGLWPPSQQPEINPDDYFMDVDVAFDGRPGLLGPATELRAVDCAGGDLAELLASLGQGGGSSSVRCAEQALEERWRTWAGVRALQTEFQAAAPLSLGFIVAFGLLYLLAIGPLDWFVIRRLDKPMWTWLSFPLLAIAFAVAASVVVSQHKAGESEANCLSVVDVVPAAGVRVAGGTCGFWSSSRRDRVVEPPPGVGFTLAADDPEYGNETVTGEDFWVESEPGRARFAFESAQWAANTIQAAWAADEAGFVRWYGTDGGGAVRNATGVDLEEAMLWDGQRWGRVGALPDGAARDVEPGWDPTFDDTVADAAFRPAGAAVDLLPAELPGRPMLVGLSRDLGGAPRIDGAATAQHTTVVRVHLPPAPEAP